MEIMNLILIALFLEAVVSTLKPIWSHDESKMSVAEYVSMALGIVIAVSCKIDMLSYVVDIQWVTPPWVCYLFYVMTGIAIGRGTNFLFDLWKKLKEWQGGALVDGMELTTTVQADIDLEITNWSLAQLKSFCALNGVNAAGCTTREDYIEAIGNTFAKETEPPEAGDAE